MNTFDIVCLVILFVSVVVGFFQGAVRMLVIMGVSYVCLILAGLYFQSIGDQIHIASDISIAESYALAFMVVFVACVITLGSMGIYTFRFLRGNTASTMNRVIGVLASSITSMVLVGVFAHLVLLLASPDNAVGTRTIIGNPDFLASIQAARIAQPLSDGVNTLLIQILDPFVFSDINQLFMPKVP